MQGDTILVDTPGIGGAMEASQTLMDYLPKALSFVFVINVASAGGMQGDRVYNIYFSLLLNPSILDKILSGLTVQR